MSWLPVRSHILYEQGRGFVIRRVEQFSHLLEEVKQHSCICCLKSFLYEPLTPGHYVCDECIEFVINMKDELFIN